MATLTVALDYTLEPQVCALAAQFAESAAVTKLALMCREPIDTLNHVPGIRAKAQVVQGALHSGAGVSRLVEELTTDFLLLMIPGERVRLCRGAIERLVSAAQAGQAGLVYSDFQDEFEDERREHALIDYQVGSIRDSFDFGAMVLLSKRALDSATRDCGRVDERLRWGGLYDLRLKLSAASTFTRVPEPLYARITNDRRASGERQFDYVDPRQRDYQLEMEQIATEHLKRIGAWLAPEFKLPPTTADNFLVRASVVIPVRNRELTIREAVISALSQVAPFEFNVIVVDNHSTDGTSAILEEIASRDRRLIHLKPARNDLLIGGCWNEAIHSIHCGRYAAQLDSDDLYADDRALEKIVARFDEGPYAMVIGSYTIVNFDLEPIPPGLIDHREWTRENGRNNALRVNGLGAPRAFYVPVIRQFGFPNVSYGEDYAVALRVSREYEIGRIYDSIYFARRWEGNSDAALAVATANRYDAYKDHLRTAEILARQKIHQQ